MIFHVMVVELSMNHVVSYKMGTFSLELSMTPPTLLSIASFVCPFPMIGGIMSVKDDKLIFSGYVVPGSGNSLMEKKN